MQQCGFVIGLFSNTPEIKLHLSVVVDSLAVNEIFLPNNKQLKNELAPGEQINYIVLIKDSFSLNFLVLSGELFFLVSSRQQSNSNNAGTDPINSHVPEMY